MADGVTHIDLGDVFAEPSDVGPGASPPRRRSRRAVVAVMAAIALLAVAVIVVNSLRPDTDAAPDRPDIGPIAAADQRRLANSAEALWSADLDEVPIIGGEATEVIVDGRSAVIAVLADERDDTPPTSMVSLDALDGSLRWRRPFLFEADTVRVLGIYDDVLAIEQLDRFTRRVLGLDLADGSTRWELATADNGVHIPLDGTQVLARVSFTGIERLTFIDPFTGDEVGRVPGRLVGTDLSGTWFVVNDRRVLALDLADGYSDPVEVIVGGATWNEPTAVIGGRVLVLDDDVLTEAFTSGERTTIVVRPFGTDFSATALVESGGSTFLGVGEGAVIGATLAPTEPSVEPAAEPAVEPAVDVGWRFEGALRDLDVSTRGLIASIVDDGRRQVVDAVTGTVIVATPDTDDEDLEPRVVGDGVVITNRSLGVERVGYDLDGEERWRVATSGTLHLGDRLLVTLARTESGYRFSAFGDAS